MRLQGLILVALMLVPGSAARALLQDSPRSRGNGLSSLMVAVRDGDRDAVKRLLKEGANPNERDDQGWTALIYASAQSDDKLVSALLEKGADINLANTTGQTPLMIAVNYGNEKAVKLLLKKGADPNVKDKSGETALGIAMQKQRRKIGGLLLKSGAKAAVLGTTELGPTRGAGEGDSTNTVGTVDTKPIPLNNPEPSYTIEARQNRVQGVVIARVLVGADGGVKNVRVTRGLPDGLTDQAIEAAYKIKFRPAMKDGKPVAYWVPVQIEFRLR